MRFTVDGASALTEYRYDDVGNAVRTVRHSWTVSSASTYTVEDLQDQVDAHAADPARIARAVYDAAGRMTFAIDAAGNVTAFTHDSAGRVIKQIAFVTAYTGSDDPLDDRHAGLGLGSPSHADDRVSRAVYDRKGQLAYSIDAEGFVTEYRYNRAGKVTLQIRYAIPYAIADGATPASVAALLPGTVPQSAEITEFLYDSAGRLEGTRDGLNILTLDDARPARPDPHRPPSPTAPATPPRPPAPTTRSAGSSARPVPRARRRRRRPLMATMRSASWSRSPAPSGRPRNGRRFGATTCSADCTASCLGSAAPWSLALGPNPDQEVVDPIWAEYATFYGYDEAGRLISTSNAVGARTLYLSRYGRSARLSGRRGRRSPRISLRRHSASAPRPSSTQRGSATRRCGR